MTLFSPRSSPSPTTDDASWPWSEFGLLTDRSRLATVPKSPPTVRPSAQSAATRRQLSPSVVGAVPEVHDWSLGSACLDEDPDLFFPVGEKGRAIVQMEHARKICLGCPVRRQCLELALKVGAEHGMWGGLTPEERKGIKRKYIKRYRHAQHW